MNPAYSIYINTLETILKNIKDKNLEVLDLGCGNLSFSPVLKVLNNKCFKLKSYIGVDTFDFKFNSSNKNIKFYKDNIFNFFTKNKKKFDVVFALDLIEHLTVKDGKRLLSMMQKLSKEYVIIFTPNGFIKQYDPINKFNNHISGWTYNFFLKKNFKIIGIYGPKALRKEFCELKSPKILNGILSLLSNIFFTRYFAKYDMSILCYKKIIRK